MTHIPIAAYNALRHVDVIAELECPCFWKQFRDETVVIRLGCEHLLCNRCANNLMRANAEPEWGVL